MGEVLPRTAAHVEPLLPQRLHERRVLVRRVVEPQHLGAAAHLGEGLPVVVFRHGVVRAVDDDLVALHALGLGLFQEAVAVLAGSQHDLLPRHEGPLVEQFQRRRGFDAAEDDGLDVIGRTHPYLFGGDQLFHSHLGLLLPASQRHRIDRHAEGAGDQHGLGRRGDVLVAVAEQHQPLGAIGREAGGADLQRAGDVGGAAVHLGGDLGQAEALGDIVFKEGVGAKHDEPGTILRALVAADGADEIERLLAHRGADAVRQVERKDDVGLLVGLRQGEARQAADQQQQREQPQAAEQTPPRRRESPGRAAQPQEQQRRQQ